MGSSDLEDALEEVHAQIRRCTRCRLSRSRQRAVPGEGAPDAGIMFVGEGPGGEEDRQGRPFVGAAGRLLTQLLERAGLDRKQIFITNVVKCRPPGNRDPLPDEIAACNDYLLAQIALITPRIVCTLGRFAGQTLIEKGISVSREHGRPRRISGILYVPLYHPAAGLHQARLIDTIEADFRQLGTVLDQELAIPGSGPSSG